MVFMAHGDTSYDDLGVDCSQKTDTPRATGTGEEM